MGGVFCSITPGHYVFFSVASRWRHEYDPILSCGCIEGSLCAVLDACASRHDTTSLPNFTSVGEIGH